MWILKSILKKKREVLEFASQKFIFRIKYTYSLVLLDVVTKADA